MKVYRFSENLKRIIADKGMTATQVAEKVGVCVSTLSTWESGKYIPTLFNAFLLSEVLEVGLDELVCGEGK